MRAQLLEAPQLLKRHLLERDGCVDRNGFLFVTIGEKYLRVFVLTFGLLFGLNTFYRSVWTFVLNWCLIRCSRVRGCVVLKKILKLCLGTGLIFHLLSLSSLLLSLTTDKACSSLSSSSFSFRRLSRSKLISFEVPNRDNLHSSPNEFFLVDNLLIDILR